MNDADRQQIEIVPADGPSERRAAWGLLTGERRDDDPGRPGFFVARDRGDVIGTALGIANEDGVLWVWPPVGATGDMRAGLLGAVCTAGFAGGAGMAQALLDEEEPEVVADLLGAGFSRLATIAFLERPIAEPVEGRELGPLSRDTFRPGQDDARLERLVEATYRDSRDCAELVGVRSAAEAIRGHRQVGAFDPAWWAVFRDGDEDVGVLLASPFPAVESGWRSEMEITYVGVTPAARGRGVASRMLADFLRRAESHRFATIRVAVDEANGPAIGLYRGLGFSPTSRRFAYVRPREGGTGLRTSS